MLESDLDFAEPAPSPDYSKDGGDLSLIRWMLSLTPAERLKFLEERVVDILAIRAMNAGCKSVYRFRLLFGLRPAVHAARLDPIAASRTE